MDGPTLPALGLLPGAFSVVRLPAATPLPSWVLDGLRGPAVHAKGDDGVANVDFLSVSRTQDELSVVAATAHVPESCRGDATVKTEDGWRCIKVDGPLDFSLVGILSGIATPLAAAGVSIFAVSTYDTDYVMVKASAVEVARETLAGAGFRWSTASELP